MKAVPARVSSASASHIIFELGAGFGLAQASTMNGMRDDLLLSVAQEVRERCLCLLVQRAARALGRRFDEALRPLDLTSGQYALLVSLNRPEPSRPGEVARQLAMDRATLSAALKPLERRGLLVAAPAPGSARGRRLRLTAAGRDILEQAVPIWRATHDAIDELLRGGIPGVLREDLLALTFGEG